jgi:hypothetical protein
MMEHPDSLWLTHRQRLLPGGICCTVCLPAIQTPIPARSWSIAVRAPRELEIRSAVMTDITGMIGSSIWCAQGVPTAGARIVTGLVPWPQSMSLTATADYQYGRYSLSA